MKINSNATKQMESIIDKLEAFPNRIASAQQSALIRSSNNLAQNLYSRYPASQFLNYTISTSGKLGYKLTISPEKNGKSAHGGDSFIVASVFLKGRKSYRVKAKGNYKMVLRPESVPPYPRALRTANIPSMKGHENELKAEIRENVIKNLQYALSRFGFGPRGGAAGLVDMPRMRSRAK